MDSPAMNLKRKTRGQAGVAEAAMVAAALRAGAAVTHATCALAATSSECVAAMPNVMDEMTVSNLRDVLPEGSVNSTTR
jgi:hypothetical protein